LFNLGIKVGDKKVSLKEFSEEIEEKVPNKEFEVLDVINSLCELKIKDKAGDFIGSRMGSEKFSVCVRSWKG